MGDKVIYEGDRALLVDRRHLEYKSFQVCSVHRSSMEHFNRRRRPFSTDTSVCTRYVKVSSTPLRNLSLARLSVSCSHSSWITRKYRNLRSRSIKLSTTVNSRHVRKTSRFTAHRRLRRSGNRVYLSNVLWLCNPAIGIAKIGVSFPAGSVNIRRR